MFRTTQFSVIFAFLILVFSPLAQANQALANAKGCLACHDIKTKKIGPAYQS